MFRVVLHASLNRLRSPTNDIFAAQLLSNCQSSTKDLYYTVCELFGNHIIQPLQTSSRRRPLWPSPSQLVLASLPKAKAESAMAIARQYDLISLHATSAETDNGNS